LELRILVAEGGKTIIVIFTKKWWVWLIRGLAGILFGITAFLWPNLTLRALVFLVGIYLIVDGTLNLIASISHQKEVKYWWIVFLEGLISVLAGVMAFIWPQLTALVLLYLIAFWAFLTGIIEVVQAVRLRKQITGEWFLIMGGIFSILFGILLLIRPGAGILAVVWILAIYAIVFGILLVNLAFRVKKYQTTD